MMCHCSTWNSSGRRLRGASALISNIKPYSRSTWASSLSTRKQSFGIWSFGSSFPVCPICGWPLSLTMDSIKRRKRAESRSTQSTFCTTSCSTIRMNHCWSRWQYPRKRSSTFKSWLAKERNNMHKADTMSRSKRRKSWARRTKTSSRSWLNDGRHGSREERSPLRKRRSKRPVKLNHCPMAQSKRWDLWRAKRQQLTMGALTQSSRK